MHDIPWFPFPVTAPGIPPPQLCYHCCSTTVPLYTTCCHHHKHPIITTKPLDQPLSYNYILPTTILVQLKRHEHALVGHHLHPCWMRRGDNVECNIVITLCRAWQRIITIPQLSLSVLHVPATMTSPVIIVIKRPTQIPCCWRFITLMRGHLLTIHPIIISSISS